jgi:hypothetical protein
MKEKRELFRGFSVKLESFSRGHRQLAQTKRKRNRIIEKSQILEIQNYFKSF